MKVLAIILFVIGSNGSIAAFKERKENRELSRALDDRPLLFATLGDGMVAVEPVSGNIIWKLKDVLGGQEINYPVKSANEWRRLSDLSLVPVHKHRIRTEMERLVTSVTAAAGKGKKGASAAASSAATAAPSSPSKVKPCAATKDKKAAAAKKKPTAAARKSAGSQGGGVSKKYK